MYIPEQRTALLSVYHKDGITEFAQELQALGWGLLASGGTCKHLRDAGLDTGNVSDLVGEPMLDHKVATLSREIFAMILADFDDEGEFDEMRRLEMGSIDLVCVDLYPLMRQWNDNARTLASIRKNTDIGGPTLLRAAAKGGRIVISDPGQRQLVLSWLKAGCPDESKFLLWLAVLAERLIADYCEISTNLLSEQLEGYRPLDQSWASLV